MEGGLRIDYGLCDGCGCIPVRTNSSIAYDWKHDLSQFTEALTEYDLARPLANNASVPQLPFPDYARLRLRSLE